MEKQKRGFALLSEQTRKAIASQGGLAAQATGKAHKFNSETAAAAARVPRRPTTKRKAK